ncbi:nicotinamide riboside transporter PnuC [Parasediminibacterium paludis]|uniref:Nicotinamide riboside transporter PnuC n=1 Tax=Parasediminibacterium paludis TaxID=908966 RepID=A0ABV8Q151_9BACT
MDISTVIQEFITGIKQTTLKEFVAVVFGIASVFLSKKENIWVYPIGLVSTIIYTEISFEGNLFGEASVNIYYTIMSIYGWILWAKKDAQQHLVVHITKSTVKDWRIHLTIFAGFYIIIYISLYWLKQHFSPGAIPWADAFASATAYTGMWLMAKKKVESWIWWILTNTASIPLYFVKGYVFTSVQYVVLLALAIAGLIEWTNRERALKVVV